MTRMTVYAHCFTKKFYEKICAIFRLWRICRKLKIKPYSWQKDFALGVTNILEYYPTRQSGRTTAIMLRLLLLDKPDLGEAACILACDWDWNPKSDHLVGWYDYEYTKMRVQAKTGQDIQLKKLVFHSRYSALCKRGRWVRYPDFYRCSICGTIISAPAPFCECGTLMTGVWEEGKL